LLISFSIVGGIVIPLQGPVETFIGLAIEVPGDTFCNDVIKEVHLGMDFWKIPILLSKFWVFAFRYFKFYICLL
jgi:hypothetical protein